VGGATGPEMALLFAPSPPPPSETGDDKIVSAGSTVVPAQRRVSAATQATGKASTVVLNPSTTVERTHSRAVRW
jgi:hypothetical protein